MTKKPRKFKATKAIRHEVPLLIGLEGPPGGGKTFSALRLATGMARVRPGRVIVIDTEGGRSKKYADLFDFDVIEMDPPFLPTDFLAAVEQQVEQAQKPAAIVIDSMSDEHDGKGGVLEWQEAELYRLAGEDYEKRGRMNRRAWVEPKADRNKMLAGFQVIKIPVIMTFRAREKTDQKTVNGKTVIENVGLKPVTSLELLHRLDLVSLLPHGSDGVPRWRSEKDEGYVIKLPEYLRPYIQEGRPLDEDMGEAFARWAMGGEKVTPYQPPQEKKQTFSEWMYEAADEGMDALKARIAKVTKQAQLDWIAERMPLLEERAKAADAIPEYGEDPAMAKE